MNEQNDISFSSSEPSVWESNEESKEEEMEEEEYEQEWETD